MQRTWNNFRYVKKSRKEHQCISCGRLTPPGSKVHNYVGEYEGDFQNWHLCDYCYEYVYPKINEEIDVYYELLTYLQYTYDTCPECGWNYGDPKVNRDKDDKCLYTITYKCGHTQDLHIPLTEV